MGIIVIFLYLKGCNKDRLLNNQIATINSYQDTVLRYKAKDGTIIDYNIALETTLDAFMAATNDSMRAYLKNIKIPKPEVITIIKERFYVDSIPSVSLNIADCKFDTIFAIINDHYEVKGRVSNEKLSLESIMIPNVTSIVIGDRREKWWKRKEHIATISHSNPYISNEGIKSFILENPSWWQRTWVKILGGAAVGSIVTWQLVK